MLEQERFRDARRLRQLARGGPVKALVGEDPAHGLDDGRTPLFTGQLRGAGFHGRPRLFPSEVSVCSLTRGVKDYSGGRLTNPPAWDTIVRGGARAQQKTLPTEAQRRGQCDECECGGVSWR